MNTELGYKVVRRTLDDELISAVVRHDDFCLSYKVGQVTYPKVKGTKLMAFKKECDARNFFLREGGEIYQAKLINPIPIHFVIAPTHMGLEWIPTEIAERWPELFKHFAQIKPNTKYNYLGAPNGTFACDGIELIKEVS